MTQATRCFGIVVPLIVLTRLILAESAATTLYVSPSGASLPPYTNRTSAAHDIAQALSASSDGDLILVDPGTYFLSNTLSVTGAVTILAIQGPTNTFINGSYRFPCVYLNNPLAVLEGFTVRGGYAESGYGGGLYLAKGSVNRCMIYNNYSDRGGGGVYAETSDSRVDNSAIYDNDVFFSQLLWLFNNHWRRRRDYRQRSHDPRLDDLQQQHSKTWILFLIPNAIRWRNTDHGIKLFLVSGVFISHFFGGKLHRVFQLCARRSQQYLRSATVSLHYYLPAVLLSLLAVSDPEHLLHTLAYGAWKYRRRSTL